MARTSPPSSGSGPAGATPGQESALTYPEAPGSVIARWNSRRGPVIYGRGESLPPLDTDLKSLIAQRIQPQSALTIDKVSPYRRKLGLLREELAGKTELALLNANLIVHLRRAEFPAHAPALFLRLWKEEAATLLDDLPDRWLISSVITFGDFGETEPQRRIGLALNVLFSLMKLYEFERLFSGVGPDEPFTSRRKPGSGMPLGMQDFGLRNGGLDFNLLAPIWEAALDEPIVGPLACRLLERLNADGSNIFRRIRMMSEDRREALARKRARHLETPDDKVT
ncbi:MAG: hypothetical protein JNK19_14195 [Tabrizicola sp.]|nr:hypothetical protein [Tabrizicola sp.]